MNALTTTTTGTIMKTTHLEAGFHLWRPLDNDIEIGIMKMIFTWDLCYDISTDTAEVPYDCRYSYETEKEAIDAFYAWDGKDFPPGNWIKRKSYRKVDLDNPNLQKAVRSQQQQENN